MFKRVHYWFVLLLLVLPASTTQAKSSAATPGAPLFIEASLENRTPWVGQEVLLTYTLFFSDVAPRIEDKTKPEHPGLWVQEVSPENYISSTPTTVNGAILRKAVIKQLRLVAMQGGKLSVTNYRLGCFLPKESQLTLDSRNDIETILTAPAAIIDARPLPKPAPEGFSSAVGSFSVSVSPENNQVYIGEPLTLLVTLSGKGNLSTLPPVSLNLPEGLRKEESSLPAAGKNNAEQKEESFSTRITLMPEKIGTFRFTPVRLTVFNPLKGRYETIASKEISVTVNAGKSPAKQQSVASPEKPSARIQLPASLIMLVMSAAVFALIIGLYLLNRKKKTPDPVQAFEKEALSPPPLSGPYPAETLRDQLYNGMKKVGILNPAGLTSRELRKKLGERKINEKTAGALLELLSIIDHAIYAPGDTSNEKLDTLNRSTSKVLADLSRH
ncbi:MAG: protein BatD [Chlorobiaceae bacterium]|nr:protein BatD [Chlorobiaceae bacterium]